MRAFLLADASGSKASKIPLRQPLLHAKVAAHWLCMELVLVEFGHTIPSFLNDRVKRGGLQRMPRGKT
ncbi:hypothetical protein B5E67_11130 [Faecalibacterium sp. An122]|nr:hypothetical protein B5E67_11130 [Faecalibacterium sp. An122]